MNIKMIQNVKPFIPLLVILFLFLAPVSAKALENGDAFKAVSTGEQVVLKTDIPGTKRSAVDAALKESVEKALLSLLSPKVFASNLDFLYNNLLTDVSDYVVNYKVLAELEKGDSYIVAVNTEIDIRALHSFLARYEIIGTEKDEPAVALFISEKTGEDLLPQYWWGKNPMPYDSKVAAAVAEQMKSEGFTVLPASFSEPGPEKENIDFDTIHDTDAAIRLGRKLDADIIVMAKAVSRPSSNRMGNEQAYEAKVDMEAFSTADDKKIASTRVKATSRSKEDKEGSMAALAKSGDLAGKKITGKIEKYWNEDVLKKQQTIEAKIEGSDYLSSFIRLRKVLDKMPEIQGIQTRELGSEEAIVEILYKGDAVGLADALLLKTFDSFGIEIYDVKDKSLTIRFVSKDENQPAVDEEEVKGAYISE
jgi:hypothetical protein